MTKKRSVREHRIYQEGYSAGLEAGQKIRWTMHEHETLRSQLKAERDKSITDVLRSLATIADAAAHALGDAGTL